MDANEQGFSDAQWEMAELSAMGVELVPPGERRFLVPQSARLVHREELNDRTVLLVVHVTLMPLRGPKVPLHRASLVITVDGCARSRVNVRAAALERVGEALSELGRTLRPELERRERGGMAS